MIRYTYATLRNKASNKVAKAGGGTCKVQQAEVTWYVSMLSVLLMHGTTLTLVISLLKAGHPCFPRGSLAQATYIPAAHQLAQTRARTASFAASKEAVQGGSQRGLDDPNVISLLAPSFRVLSLMNLRTIVSLNLHSSGLIEKPPRH